jgi:hypothetical protein
METTCTELYISPMTFALPGSVFLACRAALQRPQLDADVPVGRVADACLYWYSCKNDNRSVDCTLHYTEPHPEEPITAGLYDIETTVRTMLSSCICIHPPIHSLSTPLIARIVKSSSGVTLTR